MAPRTTVTVPVSRRTFRKRTSPVRAVAIVHLRDRFAPKRTSPVPAITSTVGIRCLATIPTSRRASSFASEDSGAFEPRTHTGCATDRRTGAPPVRRNGVWHHAELVAVHIHLNDGANENWRTAITGQSYSPLNKHRHHCTAMRNSGGGRRLQTGRDGEGVPCEGPFVLVRRCLPRG